MYISIIYSFYFLFLCLLIFLAIFWCRKGKFNLRDFWIIIGNFRKSTQKSRSLLSAADWAASVFLGFTRVLITHSVREDSKIKSNKILKLLKPPVHRHYHPVFHKKTFGIYLNSPNNYFQKIITLSQEIYYIMFAFLRIISWIENSVHYIVQFFKSKQFEKAWKVELYFVNCFFVFPNRISQLFLYFLVFFYYFYL